MGFFDTLLGNDAADASRRAAEDTYKKQQAAVSELLSYGDTLPAAYRGIAENYAPYAEAGRAGLARLLGGLGLGGEGAASEFTNAYRALPGYHAGLETGQDAVMGTAAARGMLNSGRTMKDLYRFGSNYEDQRAGDYLSRLGGLATMGQGAAGSMAATQGTGLQGQLQTRMTGYGGQYGSAGTIGQGDIAAANAQAQGLGNLLNFGGRVGGMLLGAGGLPGLSGGNAFLPSSSFMNNSWGW